MNLGLGLFTGAWWMHKIANGPPPPLSSVDFTALTAGKMTGAAYTSATGDTFARASSAIGQTGIATEDSTATTDQPIIGSRGRWWGNGRINHEARTNTLTDSRDMNAGSWSAGSGGSTCVSNAATAPDGTASKATHITVPAAGDAKFWGSAAGQAASWVSHWILANTSAQQVAFYGSNPLGLNPHGGTGHRFLAPFPAGAWRRVSTKTAATATIYSSIDGTNEAD